MMANACACSTKLFRAVAVGPLHAEPRHAMPRHAEDRGDVPGRLHVERRNVLPRDGMSESVLALDAPRLGETVREKTLVRP